MRHAPVDMVDYTQFLVYGQQLYFRLHGTGKDPQWTLTEKTQAITALRSNLKAITE